MHQPACIARSRPLTNDGLPPASGPTDAGLAGIGVKGFGYAHAFGSIHLETPMKKYSFARTLLGAAVMVGLSASPLLAQTASTDDSASGQTTTTTTTTDGQAATRLSGSFATFAGSTTNAQALVDGLRNGTPVTLDEATTNPDGTTSTSQITFQPATGQLGYGNVKIALSLAEASLAQAGITDPTAEELAAALNGGTLTLADGTTVDLQGVLAARAAGEGWGQIANAMGFKLGDVMRSPKAVGSAAAGTHANAKVTRVAFANSQRAAHAGTCLLYTSPSPRDS